MATLTEQRAALIADAKAIVDGAKAAARDLTVEENELIEAKLKEVDAVDEKAQQHKKSADLVARLTGFGNGDSDPVVSEQETGAKAAQVPEGATIGERFAKSSAVKGLRDSYGENLRDTKNPIHIEAYNLGGAADLGIGGAKATTITTATSQVPASRVQGYRSELIDEPLTFLDLITVGRTDASLLEYAQIISTEDNAAIVPEGQLKPISDVSTAKATAKAHVYADGFEVTNQVLADDGALVAYMDSRIRRNVRAVVEETIINGDSANGVAGILTTAGVQQQAFDESVIVTIARALEKLEAVQTSATAIVMNPADAWKLALTKENGVGYLVGNPLQQGLNPSPFGVRLVKSNKVAAGSALVGNFAGVQFLEREGLSVVAFNQHKDFAQRNMSYVRAELRGLQLIQAPRELVNVDLTA